MQYLIALLNSSRLTAALFFIGTIAFWPGIYMSDTHSRWVDAEALLAIVGEGGTIANYLAPVMTVLLIPFLHFGIDPGFVLGSQAAAFFFAFRAFTKGNTVGTGWALLLAALLPIHVLYFFFIVPDVWVLPLVMVLATVLVRAPNRSGVAVLTTAAACFLLFGFRPNAAVLIAPLLWIVWWTEWGRKVRAIALSLAVALGLAASMFIPQWIGFAGKTNVATGIVWEHIATLWMAEQMGVEIGPEYTLDFVGNTAQAVREHEFLTSDYLVWTAHPPFRAGHLVMEQDRILDRFKSLMLAHPGVYLRAKARIIACHLGYCGLLRQTVMSMYSQPGSALPQGYQGGNWLGDRILAFSNFIATTDNVRHLYTPILWIAAGALVMVSMRHSFSRQDWFAALLLTSYAASFAITSQAASYRYLFPTVFFCVYVAAKAVLQKGCSRFKSRAAAEPG